MLARLLTILIIGFWLVMTGLLLRSIWFPADSRLARVDPAAVLELIAARGEPSALDLYDDRRIIGNLSIQSVSFRLNRRDRVRLRLSGKVNLSQASLAGTTVYLESWIEISQEGGIPAFYMNLRTGDSGTSLTVSLEAGAEAPVVRLKQNRLTLLNDVRLDDEALKSHPMLVMLAGAAGPMLPDLKELRRQAAREAPALEVEARQGEFDLKGTKREGFVVRLGRPGGAGLRMCVENTGEIVIIETPSSWHFLTETFRPEPAAGTPAP